jgi:hypothetical protein
MVAAELLDEEAARVSLERLSEAESEEMARLLETSAQQILRRLRRTDRPSASSELEEPPRKSGTPSGSFSPI